jgi:hypothetical protein
MLPLPDPSIAPGVTTLIEGFGGAFIMGALAAFRNFQNHGQRSTIAEEQAVTDAARAKLDGQQGSFTEHLIEDNNRLREERYHWELVARRSDQYGRSVRHVLVNERQVRGDITDYPYPPLLEEPLGDQVGTNMKEQITRSASTPP